MKKTELIQDIAAELRAALTRRAELDRDGKQVNGSAPARRSNGCWDVLRRLEGGWERTRHHAIIVTSSNELLLDAAWGLAREIFPYVSPITPSANLYASFFIPPDGSGEGRPESDAGDSRRDEFVAWLEAQRYGDGSSSLRWVEIAYGEDDCKTAYVVRNVNGGGEE